MRAGGGGGGGGGGEGQGDKQEKRNTKTAATRPEMSFLTYFLFYQAILVHCLYE